MRMHPCRNRIDGCLRIGDQPDAVPAARCHCRPKDVSLDERVAPHPVGFLVVDVVRVVGIFVNSREIPPTVVEYV